MGLVPFLKEGRWQHFCIHKDKFIEMKNLSLLLMTLLLLLTFSSCHLIGGIFKAGMGVGIFVVILIIVIIGWLISRSRNKS
jgi:hypothetical protein